MVLRREKPQVTLSVVTESIAFQLQHVQLKGVTSFSVTQCTHMLMHIMDGEEPENEIMS